MNLFAALAALITVVALVAVLFPLWKSSRPIFLAALVTLGLGAIALYRLVGTPAAMDLQPQSATAEMPQDLDTAVKQLEDALARNPNEVEGWRLLGRTYLSMERYADAQAAFAKALKITPDDADVLVENAQARLYADPRKQLDAEGVALLERALTIAPQHQRARWFLGVAQRQQGKPAEAAKTWEPLLAGVDGNTATTLRAQINEARAEAGLPALAAPPVEAIDAATGPVLLRARVEIAPELKDKVGAQDTVFVFARQRGGPPMPVAAKRLTASELPASVALSDADSPMPTLKLSQVQEVELVARVSKAGDVMAKSGDLEASAIAVKAGDAGEVVLTIDRIVP
ncbi:tetratricopeptide repeat protein [Pseudoxanthomonas indica]|uniref:Cytochrome c-type biogenesis protein CcmH n=1 Tax=Pseudoxanthomonas indica TaxID=428993 RepID=A0A1T5IWR5_9GAMM|nr:tetratricopeptide repeat protein [Pseudoxanthomonas indica]GGD54818.1 cytochrome c biogenesis protein [Pseudoxanthomonas indica]SKC43532.1 cytochrome c-type biogenesis protein CcmH [Pseudoxanthomonas indica]